MSAVLSVLYTVLLVLVAGAAAALSVLSWWRPVLPFVAAAGGAVAAALLLSAIAVDDLGFGVLALVTALALVAAVVGGGPAATVALRLATRGEPVTEGSQGGIIEKGREVLRGGTAIGVLERLALAGVILAGFPEGLAVIVAVKGVGRFGEFESPASRERFIIGTFASLIWAAAAAGIAVLARG